VARDARERRRRRSLINSTLRITDDRRQKVVRDARERRRRRRSLINSTLRTTDDRTQKVDNTTQCCLLDLVRGTLTQSKLDHVCPGQEGS